LAHLLRKGKNGDEEESGKRILGLMIGRKKGVHFFGKECCEKCTGVKKQRKREIEKDSSKVEVPIILSKEIILGHPCIPCAGLMRVAIRSDSENKGRGWGGGGGADTRRKGLKEDFM
jgi:hypothetical protein